jgi:hypothetical protein
MKVSKREAGARCMSEKSSEKREVGVAWRLLFSSNGKAVESNEILEVFLLNGEMR